MVYLFDTDPVGVDGEVAAQLRQAVEDWAKVYPDSTLVRVDEGERIRIRDRRGGWPEHDHLIDDPVLVAAYRQLEHGRLVPALRTRLADEGFRLDVPRAEQWLAELVAAGLVFVADGRYLALATTSVPMRIQT